MICGLGLAGIGSVSTEPGVLVLCTCADGLIGLRLVVPNGEIYLWASFILGKWFRMKLLAK